MSDAPIDWSKVTPEEVESKGKRSFAAGGVTRFLYGEGGRFIIDIREENGRRGIATVFDRSVNRTVWPAPKRARSGPTTVRRLAWEPGGRQAGTIRLTADDLARLLSRRAEIERDGHIDVPIRVERI